MFKVLNGGKMPTRATKYSACVDLYAREDVEIHTGETKIIPLGVKICGDSLSKILVNSGREFMDDYFKKSHYLALHIRSGLAAKGLVQNNGEGIVDLDFSAELGLIVSYPVAWDFGNITLNQGCGRHPFTIKAGDRVAQCTLMEHKGYLMGIDSEEERIGGFGSSGVN